ADLAAAIAESAAFFSASGGESQPATSKATPASIGTAHRTLNRVMSGHPPASWRDVDRWERTSDREAYAKSPSRSTRASIPADAADGPSRPSARRRPAGGRGPTPVRLLAPFPDRGSLAGRPGPGDP